MKKLLIRFLTFSLAMAMLLPAASAEGICLNQLEQNVFVSTSFIEKEAYPEVVFNVSPFIYDLSKMVYLRFPAPDGVPFSFSENVSSFYIEDPSTEQSYQMLNAAFETFLNNAADSGKIILNEENAAAYYDIGYYCRAYGLIATPELGKNTKLYISMTFHDYSENTLTDKQTENIKNAILSEIERIQKNIRFETRETYWSDGFYDAVNIRSLHAPLSVKFTFDELPFLGKDNQIDSVRPFLTEVDDTKFVMVAQTPSGKPKIEFDVNPFSYAARKKDSEPESVFTIVLDDGYEYDICGNLYDNSRYTSFNASRLLTDKTKDGRNLYLTWSVSGNSVCWYSKEDIAEIMNALMSHISVETELELLNYRGAAAEAEEPQEEPAKSVKGGWGFFNANTEADANTEANTGAQANPDAWTCDCGSVNTSKFCPECGTKKPDYKCQGCDYVFEKDSTFKFCPECGTKR